MERVRENIAESRAHTDASLGAERASTDADSNRMEPRAQREMDDLIERDRHYADEQLWKFRASADSMLARERSGITARNSAISVERQVADESKQAEREDVDVLLVRERQRADFVIAAERREHETQRARLEAHRRETNDQLSVERSGTDIAVGALYDTRNALADAQSEQGRRGDVLGMVTHDLRSPLCVIAMNAQIITECTTDAPMREAAEDVTRAAARMERLLTDLLDVARIESGTLRIVKRKHDVGALVAEVFRSYRPLFAERRIAFTSKAPVDPVVTSFDYDRIIQVLSNLLGNAMKFTPARGSVALHVERKSERIEFMLSDTGPGIAPDALPHIFERFWQIDSDTRRGLGLGLHICQKIIEAHGGRIWVESEFGKGATFRFTLPVH